MTKTNTEIVRGFIETINQNRFDRLFEFASQDSISHGSPYVGLGIMLDDSSGDHVTIVGTAPGGPADGVLQQGDILLKVTDGARIWSSFPELKSSEWGQGIPGTPLTLSIKRDGQTLDFHLLRGQIPGWDQKLSGTIDYWREYKLRVWPDLKTDANSSSRRTIWSRSMPSILAPIWSISGLQPGENARFAGLGTAKSSKAGARKTVSPR